ncbi:WD domain, G-beta repeat [Carpediemonas membranifera]|uniref:WD domain, G-beta repeat n=1 Tax=Carpediemonas membranifera TaxID=201153 RepID=A0A8J6E2J8_9EUKA|nr:WD domain, G-beta repeat [Carpediemonas membranifera]|eukprot:KAG9394778.1 WD domain, G-beta repeat [Carpediemonas membranifera]
MNESGQLVSAILVSFSTDGNSSSEGGDGLAPLKRYFDTIGDEFDHHQFQQTIIRYFESISPTTDINLNHIHALFAEIDANNDGLASWADFCDYLIDSGLSSSGMNQGSTLKCFLDAGTISDPINRDTDQMIQKIVALNNGMVFGLEGNESTLSMYNQLPLTYQGPVRLHGNPSVLDVVLVEDYAHVIVSAADGTLRHLDSQTLKQRGVTTVPSLITSLHYDRGAGSLFGCCIDGTVLGLDAATMKIRKKHVNAHTDACTAITPLHGISMFATAGLDAVINLWSTDGMHHRKTLKGHTKGIAAIAYSTQFRSLVSAGFDHDALVWNPFISRLVGRLQGHTAPILDVSCVPSSPVVVTASQDRTLRIFDIRDMTCTQVIPMTVSSITIHPTTLNIICANTKLQLFAYDGTDDPTHAHESTPTHAVYNKHQAGFATAAGCQIRFWDGSTGKLQRQLMTNDPVTAMGVSDDGRRLVVSDSAGRLTIYQWQTKLIVGSQVLTDACPSVSDVITSLCFLPTSQILLAGTAEGCVFTLTAPNAASTKASATSQTALFKRTQPSAFAGASSQAKAFYSLESLNRRDAVSVIPSELPDAVYDDTYTGRQRRAAFLEPADIPYSVHSPIAVREKAFHTVKVVTNVVGHDGTLSALDGADLFSIFYAAGGDGTLRLFEVTSVAETQVLKLQPYAAALGATDPELPAIATLGHASGLVAATRAPFLLAITTPPGKQPVVSGVIQMPEECGYVICMEYNEPSHTLLVGSSTGMVGLVDMIPLLAGTHAVIPSYDLVRSDYHIRFIDGDVPETMVLTVSDRTLPCFQPRMTWTPHTDAVTVVRILENPTAYVTASADCRVFIHSAAGKVIGSLSYMPESLTAVGLEDAKNLSDEEEGESNAQAKPTSGISGVLPKHLRKIRKKETSLQEWGFSPTAAIPEPREPQGKTKSPQAKRGRAVQLTPIPSTPRSRSTPRLRPRGQSLLVRTKQTGLSVASRQMKLSPLSRTPKLTGKAMDAAKMLDEALGGGFLYGMTM